MGLFNRKPGLGKTFRFTQSKESTAWTYGIMVTHDTAAFCSADGKVQESAYRFLTYGGGRFERVPDPAVPRRVYRALINHMGVLAAEQMLGPASDEILDARWELIQKGDGKAAAELVDEVTARRPKDESASYDGMIANALRCEATESLRATESVVPQSAGEVQDDGEPENVRVESLPSATPGRESKCCPECAEHVQSAARKCRFCGYRFEPPIEGPA